MIVILILLKTRAINTLKESNALERAGAKKNGYWIVKV